MLDAVSAIPTSSAACEGVLCLRTPQVLQLQLLCGGAVSSWTHYRQDAKIFPCHGGTVPLNDPAAKESFVEPTKGAIEAKMTSCATS
jgi:hypothetical protein